MGRRHRPMPSRGSVEHDVEAPVDAIAVQVEEVHRRGNGAEDGLYALVDSIERRERPGGAYVPWRRRGTG